MGNVEDKIIEQLNYETILTNYTKILHKLSNKSKLDEFADFRKFTVDILNECEIFYIGETTQMLIPTYIDKIKELGVISETNNKPIFHDRFVIPIKNAQGMVQNLVGYSKDANERYIYGTSKYYRRRETLWGLENLNLAYDMGYAIVTEGITDAIRLRDMGYKNTFAMCGTHSSDFIMKQLNRCRHGIIRVPDRDNAGIRALKGWECNRHVTISVALQYKDVDEMCREGTENQEWFMSYLNACIEWVLSGTHNGRKCACEKITIM